MTTHAHGPEPSPGHITMDHLRAEHAEMLRDLDRLSAALVSAPAPDFPAARDALESWIRQVLIPHAEREEDSYVEAADLPAGLALLESMESEHRILCEAAARFSGVWNSHTAGAWARGLFAMFEAHQRKENELLFPELLAARNRL